MFSVCWSIKSSGGVSQPVNSNSMSPDTVTLVVKPIRQDGWDHTCPTDVQVLLIGSWWVNTTVQMTPAVSVRVASLSDDRWLKQSSLCCHHLTSDSVSLLQFLFISRSHWCYCNRMDVCPSFDFQCPQQVVQSVHHLSISFSCGIMTDFWICALPIGQQPHRHGDWKIRKRRVHIFGEVITQF